MVIMGQGHN